MARFCTNSCQDMNLQFYLQIQITLALQPSIEPVELAVGQAPLACSSSSDATQNSLAIKPGMQQTSAFSMHTFIALPW